jgi:hypothetical protein
MVFTAEPSNVEGLGVVGVMHLTLTLIADFARVAFDEAVSEILASVAATIILVPRLGA